MNRKLFLLSIIALGLGLFASANWYVNRTATVAENTKVSQELTERLERPYSPVLGSKNAPVTIVEFFDPACEACRAFHPIVKEIMKTHGSAVKVVIRYTPFHGEGSEFAIRVLEAARMQQLFEPVLEALLREQPRWAAHGNMRLDLILQIAVSAGLDPIAAQNQMKAPQIVGLLNQERADIQSIGVQQTPTFFVNGKPLKPFGAEELKALVATEVNKAETLENE